eukprot:scaffold60207_cov58-Phaeocystis_antarctica.AAC.1
MLRRTQEESARYLPSCTIAPYTCPYYIRGRASGVSCNPMVSEAATVRLQVRATCRPRRSWWCAAASRSCRRNSTSPSSTPRPRPSGLRQRAAAAASGGRDRWRDRCSMSRCSARRAPTPTCSTSTPKPEPKPKPEPEPKPEPKPKPKPKLKPKLKPKPKPNPDPNPNPNQGVHPPQPALLRPPRHHRQGRLARPTKY